MKRTVTIYPNAEELAQAGAVLIADRISEAIARCGRCTLALAGGSTPRSLYTALAQPACAAQIDWARIFTFWSDERCVPPDAPESNYGMATETLLTHVPLPTAHIHRMRGELEPHAAADDYEATLRRHFPDAAWPRFDLLLLGLGEDGHIASLFPGTAALDETERWVAANYVPLLDTWRLTLTLPVINHAAEVIILVSGRQKAGILHEVLLEADRPALLPAQRVAPIDGTLRWLVDAEAAALLDPG